MVTTNFDKIPLATLTRAKAGNPMGVYFSNKLESMSFLPCFAELRRSFNDNKRRNMYYLMNPNSKIKLDPVFDGIQDMFSNVMELNYETSGGVVLITITMIKDMSKRFQEVMYYILFPLFRAMDSESYKWWRDFEGEINNLYDLIFNYFYDRDSMGHQINDVMYNYRDNKEILDLLIQDYIRINTLVFGEDSFDFLDKELNSILDTYYNDLFSASYGIGRTNSYIFIEQLVKGKLKYERKA